MTKFYAQEKRVFDINKVTVVGSPTITSDGVASGFSSENYIGLLSPITLGENKSWEVQWKGKIPELVTGNFITNYFTVGRLNSSGSISALLYLYNADTESYANLQLSLSELGSTFVGKSYNAIIKYDGVSNYTFVLKIEDGTERTDTKTSSSYYKNINLRLGGATLDTTFDLSQFSITVDGELVYSPTKPVYSLERRKEGFDLSKFTVVGSPTITEAGVASGFSVSNYLTKTQTFDLSKPFSFKGEFKTSSDIRTQQFLFATNMGSGAFGFQIASDLNFYVYYPPKSGNNFTKIRTVTANTTYNYSLDYDGSSLSITLNGEKYTVTNSNFEPSVITFVNIGISRAAIQPFTGSIDLTQFSITVDGKEVFTGAKEKFYAMRRM